MVKSRFESLNSRKMGVFSGECVATIKTFQRKGIVVVDQAQVNLLGRAGDAQEIGLARRTRFGVEDALK